MLHVEIRKTNPTLAGSCCSGGVGAPRGIKALNDKHKRPSLDTLKEYGGDSPEYRNVREYIREEEKYFTKIREERAAEAKEQKDPEYWEMIRQYEEHREIEEDKNPLQEAKESLETLFRKVDKESLLEFQNSLNRLKSTGYDRSKITSMQNDLYRAQAIIYCPEDKQKDLKNLGAILLNISSILNGK